MEYVLGLCKEYNINAVDYEKAVANNGSRPEDFDIRLTAISSPKMSISVGGQFRSSNNYQAVLSIKISVRNSIIPDDHPARNSFEKSDAEIKNAADEYFMQKGGAEFTVSTWERQFFMISNNRIEFIENEKNHIKELVRKILLNIRDTPYIPLNKILQEDPNNP